MKLLPRFRPALAIWSRNKRLPNSQHGPGKLSRSARSLGQVRGRERYSDGLNPVSRLNVLENVNGWRSQYREQWLQLLR